MATVSHGLAYSVVEAHSRRNSCSMPDAAAAVAGWAARDCVRVSQTTGCRVEAVGRNQEKIT